MSYILEANGHRVRQANHGRVGVHIASLNRFDAIFVDLSMKTMDPYEVIKRIKVNMSSSKTLYYNPSLSSRRQQECPQHGTGTIIIGLVYSECDLKTIDIDHIIPICTNDEQIMTKRSLQRFPVKFSRILTCQESSNPIAMKIDNDFSYVNTIISVFIFRCLIYV